VDFDSHMSNTVATTVAAVNVVTPGDAHGRPYQPPTGDALVDDVVAALRHAYRPTAAEIAELATYLDRLRDVFVQRAADGLDGACARCNDLLRSTGAIPELARHDGEAWHLHFHPVAAPWAVGWAGSMATALAVVLGSASHDRLGVCSAPVCDRVYVDTSRNGARRFCSTACQNRVKAAAFRDRRRT
jgi:predicted RNA-binding Zn ribbon-like protein